LAKETGGAYESISPNESGAEVITRSFYKMRGGELRDVKIEWGKKPLWESELPKIIYCGETLRVFAQFQSPPDKPPVLSYVIATEKKELTPTTFAKTDNPIITKLGGAKKYDDTQSHESKLELALRYQLLTPQTALLLIFENVIKAEGTSTLQKVPQMLAAGWGGTSSVEGMDFACDCDFKRELPGLCCLADVDESESSTSDTFFCFDMSPPERKKFSPRIDILENILQSVSTAESHEDNEKLARKLWKDQNWLNKIPSGTVEAEQITVIPEEYCLNLSHLSEVGQIIAINVLIGEEQERGSFFLCYNETKNVLTIIVLHKVGDALLRSVLKSYILSKAVNKEKLLQDICLQDFKLPIDAQVAAAVLAKKSDEINNEMQRRYTDRLIKKLKVTILQED
jgi:hypothetical protein